ncbi:porin OmpL1 [Leptospira yasudae]|uniref:Porin OmpL1 n=1 Tax=Leptospira yasudae TaxID=2202201 RepID=A0ABX9M686_9LEPT|nr:porin OmpL1 [Leptospira yasudae]RHX81126.1 porin OmpL1 [Leptospira yasudae]TGK30148.1 porin OmpL1 [Leptospira yasudae]TGM04471.1 porin OmpL1 [Leptospira yasudae]
MFRKLLTVVFVVSLTLLSLNSISAKSYVFGSLGLQFDLAQMGGTITKDGLDSANYYDVASGGTGGNANAGVAPRRAVIPENRLQTLENTTAGLINVKANGAMSGLVFSAGYEKEFGKFYFARIAANYTRKYFGGDTEAKALGFKFYDITWDYNAIQIPINVGIKVSVSEDNAIYIGGGVHYFKGGWSLAGSNLSNVVHDIATPISPTIGNLVSDGINPTAAWEDVRFSVSGVAPNWIVGAQSRLTEKGFIYLEAETFYSYKLGTGHTQSAGGILGLSPSPSYPVVLGGTQYRVGYKHEL